jgi:hypothetical protein
MNQVNPFGHLDLEQQALEDERYYRRQTRWLNRTRDERYERACALNDLFDARYGRLNTP